MRILETISSIAGYVLIVMIGALVFYVIKILSKLSGLSKTMDPINEGLKHMQETSDNLNRMGQDIRTNIANALPFYIRVFFMLSVLRVALNDFFRTKPSKRDLNESLRRAYRYETLLRENKALKKASGR